MIYTATVKLTAVLTLVVHASYIGDRSCWGWTATAQVRGAFGVEDFDMTVDSSYLIKSLTPGQDIDAAVRAVNEATRSEDIIQEARSILAIAQVKARRASEARMAAAAARGEEVPF